ncbi:lytic murein transglycosylase [Micromonospora sp. DH14]|uniref:lytic murein transglycosylase n=1 Tax=Micromonospora sp. DH14 TaxID=3040120 RepID=UPI0024424851|nr:lytic murein transglycosylase [Micromonospora sp. DH14]MDG9678375.1 lytic murein transglycosylase [Micromonospora sp. DH14]
MVDGEDDTRVQPLRPAAPLEGPLEGSGAAPDPVRAVPRPRRPWLSGRSKGAAATPPATVPTPPTTPGAKTEAPRTEAAKAATPNPADAKIETVKAEEAKAEAAKAETPKADDAKTGATAGATDLAKTTVDELPAVPASGPARRRRRVQFAHAVRVPPRQAAAAAARATRAWAGRPSGRLTLPGVFLLALVAATAAAGALLVPATIRAPRPVAVDASAAPGAVAPTAAPSGLPTGPLPTGPLPTIPLPSGGLPGTGLPPGTVTGGRPSDALAGWAQQVGAKVGVPAIAMQAYGYAELVLAQTNRSCALSWTTLAAIGQVESGHGSANGARLGQDGKALPPIIGLPLDGKEGRMRIIDTDGGALDGDRTLDRAIGPMQFIPTTWQEIGADADNDGRKDPHDLDDAALAAGNYLCKGGRNLSIPGDWWNAILSYNDVRRYAQDVYDTANRYGRASRS